MNWKSILIKGLPVLGILVAIAIIFAVASRPKPVPKVSNQKQVVVDFKDLKINKGEMYDLLKNSTDLQTGTSYSYLTMLRDVDSIVLKDYFDKVDEEALDDLIKSLKGETEESEQAYYDQLTLLGISKGADETDEQFEARVRDYHKYNFNLVQKAAAQERAKDSLTTEDITEAKNDYKKDLCIIPLEFDNVADRDELYNEIKDLKGSSLLTKVLDAYNAQQEDSDDEDEAEVDESKLSEEEKFFNKQITCEYERVEYNKLSKTYRDFVYDINKGEAKTSFINNKYHVVYVFDKATDPSEYSEADKVQFEKIIVDKLVAAKTTSTYIKETVKNLRKDAGFKIFDYTLAEKYEVEDTSFKVSKSKDKQAVYQIGDKVVTADEFYETLKTTNALLVVFNKINYEVLSRIDEIQLSKKEMEDINKSISNAKAQFTQTGTVTWSQQLKMFGANTEEELANLIALDDLRTRYILGHTVKNKVKYAGVYPVTQEELNEIYKDWFEIHASHILFKLDENATDKEVDRKRNELLALQIVRGINTEAQKNADLATALLTDDEFIRYDYNGDGVLGPKEDNDAPTFADQEYFKGLKNTAAADYAKVFKDLATRYSDDSSAANGGSLDDQQGKGFGPGSMLKEFEDAVLKIAEGDYPFSTVQDSSKVTENDTVALTKYGYHVIYFRGQEDKPEIPAGYDTKSLAEIRQVLATETNADLKAYADFLTTFETQLEQEHMAKQQKYLSELLDKEGFKFLDKEIQAYYERIVAIDTRDDSTEETE